jgi:GTP-binding protein Era
MEHKAGFVSIIGKPNAGKSTLMNSLVGEKLSIVTSKAQTTRHRIMGIVNGEDYQIIFSDTPGIIKPAYELQKSMMSFVSNSLEDADVILFVADIKEKAEDEELISRLNKTTTPILVILNKTDLATEELIKEKAGFWNEKLRPKEIIPVSALIGANVQRVFDAVIETIPVHPPYYEKDALTDKPERFFAGEVIREKIFENFKKEVPYSTEVVISEFKETESIIRMRAEIYVERTSQKGIIIGKAGEALKKIGIAARIDLEKFFGKQVYLETHVKVEKDWRKKENALKRFGYDHL